MRSARAAAVLAGVSVVLALGCAGMAAAWRHERARGDCWRELAEEGVSSAAPCPS